MKSWTARNLGSLIESVSETFKFTEQPVIFLNTSDILAGKFLHAEISDPKTLPGQAKKRIKKGDLLLSEIRPANKRFALVDFDAENYVVSTKLMVLRSKGEIDVDYLKLYLTSEEVLDYLQMIAEDRSGTFPQITFDILDRMEILLPTVPEQKAIAAVLSTLDDKIDLLHRQNRTLEAMAETLFRQWFVEEAQEDWEIRPLGDFVTVKRGGSPRPIQEYLSETGFRWLKISDATKTASPYIFDIREHIKEEGLNKTTLLKKGTLVLSNSATPGIPKILQLDSCIHDGWLHFPKSHFSNEFLYLLFKKIRPELINQGNGSIFTNLKTDILKEYPIPIADDESLQLFDAQVKPIFEKLLKNATQIQTLEKLRDTLLPKLMNGEVRISI